MEAPGGPGAPPMWGPGRKMAFGTAPGSRSKVWYTLADGNLSEVFFPFLDRIALHELRFFVSASGAPPVDDSKEAQHGVTWLSPGVPAFRVDSTHHEYRLTKEFFSDPEENAVLVAANFTPELPDLRLYVQASAHWQPGTEGNHAQVIDTHPPALLLQQQDIWICVVGPFARATVGYYRSSDIHIDLSDGDGRLSYSYDRSGPGNATVGAEIGVRAGAFQLAVGFAHSRADAEEVARTALQKGAGAVRQAFELAWRSQPEIPQALGKVSGDEGTLARASFALLHCLEDKSHAGAFIAAPAAPWGELNHDGNHVYHLVWPRDLCRIATALLDAGDSDAALRAFRHLQSRQRSDGGWYQNWALDGTPHWQTTELDQVALPILLAWRLGVAGCLDHDPYVTMVRPAAQFLLREGPLTPLDRWEDAGGLSPSTLAACIAALIVGAEFASDAGEHVAANHLRAVADYWNDRVESWCSLPSGQFVRLGSDPDRRPNQGAIAPEFLELVRYGLRRPKDERVLRSLQGVDTTLKVSLPGGPSWRRYVGDQYGEHEDGAAWNGSGRGRAWPVLTGERARHFFSMGLPAAELLRSLEGFAGQGLMLPEQLWDGPDIPNRGLQFGKPSGSASPLGWAHAEYLELLVTVALAGFPDIVMPARRRYAEGAGLKPPFVWSHKHQITRIAAGRSLKVQLPRPGDVHYTFDGWKSHVELPAADTTLGVWVAEVPCDTLPVGTEFQWTAHYMTGWEGRNFSLKVE
ncbi:MAG TPA: glycoside hydrolase family 15 protein [Candidatus Dormibacteraeota bacterium]|nr:glycoside hydrolase family 15 protein [Candidatus Dormibacteraeota bacterium]